MADTYMGATYKIADVVSVSPSSLADAYANMPSDSAFTDFPLIYPYYESSYGATPLGYLYQGQNLNNAYAFELDSCFPLWQQATMIYSIDTAYDSASAPIPSDVMSLFPNRHMIPLGGCIYITHPSLNTVVCVNSACVFYCFYKDTGSQAIASGTVRTFFNFIYFYKHSLGSMVINNWIFANKYSYNANRIFNVGYATTQMRNNFHISQRGTTTFNATFFRLLQDDYIPPAPIQTNDPYDGGGTSDTGGGTGTFSDTSTPIDFPALPSVSAVDAGFIKLYNPTLAQLNSLAAYMWTGLDLTAFKKIFADPMECILGLSLVPVAVPDGATEEIYVGNIGTGVNMTKANSQYVEVDCGTLEVKEFWGAYLDFSPYTKLELYLPYIGIHQVDADEIVGKTIHIKYHVDILTGACIAYVKCGDSVLYSFNGQCSANVPLTSRDWTNTLNGIISIAGSIGSLVASGGANAPSAISNIASSAMNAVKPTIEKSGSLSGVGGMMGIQTPYLILTRPKQALPENQNSFSGYPSFITVTLSEITGYAEIESIHLENIPCTGAELSEIEVILKEGVIL